MDLVWNDVDTLHEEIKYLVGHLVSNDVNTLHEERIYLIGFSFIRVIDMIKSYLLAPLNQTRWFRHCIYVTSRRNLFEFFFGGAGGYFEK